MKAGLYIRVSDKTQAKEGLSLATQERELRDYCRHENIEVFQVYRDAGISGAKANRKGLDALLADAKAGKFDVVLATKVDRASRSLKLTLSLIEQLKEMGISVRFIQDNIFKSDDSKLQIGLIGLIADWERDRIRERTHKGIWQRVLDGTATNKAKAPFGYHYVNKTQATGKIERELVKNPALEPTVKAFWESCLTASSLNGVARAMNARKLSFPAKAGDRLWRSRDVDIVVNNLIYSGTQEIGKRATAKGDAKKWQQSVLAMHEKTKDGVYRRYHSQLAYIDSDTQQSIIAKLCGKALPGTRARNTENPLLGILRCKHCGQPMYSRIQYRNKADGTRYGVRNYSCSTKEDGGDCVGQQVSHKLVMAAIVPLIKIIPLEDVKKLAELWQTPDQDVFNAKIIEIRNERARVIDEQKRFAGTFSAFTPEIMHVYTDRLREYQGQIDALTAKLDQYERSQQKDDTVSKIVAAWDSLEDRLADDDWSDQRMIIKATIRNVIVDCTGNTSKRAATVLYFESALLSLRVASEDLPESNPMFPRRPTNPLEHTAFAIARSGEMGDTIRLLLPGVLNNGRLVRPDGRYPEFEVLPDGSYREIESEGTECSVQNGHTLASATSATSTRRSTCRWWTI